MTVVPGALHVVSTPIGHLGDVTARALEVLRGVAAICCEDTRHTRTLLERYAIPTPVVAYHEHNEAAATPRLLARLAAGEALALVSDAGTPLVSDPGARLVRAALDAGVRVVPVPGPSALLAALVVSGCVTDRFTYHGFLPRKGGERTARVAEVARAPLTQILYEAPGRVHTTLAALAAAGAAERSAVVARELTKAFETVHRGTVAELAARFADEAPRGEVVIVLDAWTGSDGVDEAALRAAAAAWRADGAAPRDVVARLQAEFGAPRNLAYKVAHA